MALLILKQIVEDIREYISSQIADEMALMNLYSKLKNPRRSRSCPNLLAYRGSKRR